MALRSVSRRFAIPALRRASGPRVSPSAGSRPPASRSSHAGYSNGDAGWKHRHEETAEQLARYKASADAAEAALRDIRKMEKLERRVNIAAPVLALVVSGYSIYVIDRDHGWVFEPGAFSREPVGFVGADTGEADIDEDEADMEGDQKA